MIDNVKIIPLEYGKSQLPESMVFINGATDKSVPISFIVYLIKTDNRMILVDAGCETMPGFDMTNFIGTVNALKNKGISPDDITDVIITHSHHDHIECVKYFKNAVIHIQKDEFEIGKKYIPFNFDVNIFDECYSLSKNITVIKTGGHSQGSCIVEVKTKHTIYAIIGDECYSHECIDMQIATGSSFCLENSFKFIEKYKHPKYTLLYSHDNCNSHILS